MPNKIIYLEYLSMKTRMIAIDASTKSTGIAIFDKNTLLHYECITSASTNVFKRIDVMIKRINELIEEYKIEYAVIEDVLPEDVRNNQNTFRALVYLQGFILHSLDKHKIDWKFFTSSQWRKCCGIHTGPRVKRETLKQQDIAFVKKNYNINVNDDIADAICIGYAEVCGKEEETIKVDGFEFK